MIGKVSRGSDTAGLLRYLFGPGRANEHTDPRLVAAWDDTVLADHLATTAADGRPRVKDLAALLDHPLALLHHPVQRIGRGGPEKPAATVWHCSLRAAPGDRRLSDADWAVVAADVVTAAGLAPHGDQDGCRWVAVRHAEDHVHLAVTLARQDGRRPRTSHDYARVGAACMAAEVRLGLTVTAPRDRTAARQPTRAETEKARRQGLAEPPRVRLRREVRRAAATSGDLDDFVRSLDRRGVEVRLRFSQQDATVVTGYAVALRPDARRPGGPVWFGGGRLAPQLSLPRLSSGWLHARTRVTDDVTTAAVRPRQARAARSRAAPLLRGAAAVVRQASQGDGTAAALTAATTVTRAVRAARRR